MIPRADCISEHVLNGNMSPRGNLCYFGCTFEKRSGSHSRSREKEDKEVPFLKSRVYVGLHRKNHIN